MHFHASTKISFFTECQEYTFGQTFSRSSEIVFTFGKFLFLRMNERLVLNNLLLAPTSLPYHNISILHIQTCYQHREIQPITICLPIVCTH